jgi:hypothetical protein
MPSSRSQAGQPGPHIALRSISRIAGLLPQPGGFEGFIPVAIQPYPHDLAFAHGRDFTELPLDCRSANAPVALLSNQDDHFVT